VRVLGVGDPTVTALRTIPPETIDRTYRAQYASTRRLVREESPDLLLVHSPVQATPVLGDVDAIAAGHLHRTTLDIVDGSVIAIVGSSGATGLGDLLVDESSPYRFELLRFIDGTLVAVDQIELRGATGDFVLNRRLIGGDEEDTEGDSLTEEVDEPSLEEIEESDPDALERLPNSTTSTTSTTTTTTDDGG
jgi:hypothetical protein